MPNLSKTLDALVDSKGTDFFRNHVPKYIYSNLRKDFIPRLYQQEAFGRFVFFWKNYQNKPQSNPIQLLYHMATGSGKTLIMAGLIIYLYEQGYRNFLFFVNSTNIIEKTKDNFFNSLSSKYLFANNIIIGDNRVKIKELENFQAANPNDINIVFSTIQGLHSKLNTPRENSLTYNDFEESKIVLISDEAHHINAETKKKTELNKNEIADILSWENTVNRIFNANSKNILLEFTATIDFSHPQIKTKYSDKLIFDYPLKQFRIDGFSKEVKVLQADLPKFERALQSIIISQYRRKIFEKNRIIIKPVILFKSKTIKESQEFFDEFIIGIKNLKVSDLKKIKEFNKNDILSKVFQYLDYQNISLENFITELKEDFSEDNLISVNSQNESEIKQLAINSLEDKGNKYRIVFAVNKLNEGWDVLNLFDIVRLYNTRNSKQSKPGKTTMAEAQLIGRGARYCPFKINNQQQLYKRKYDDDIENELKICEELYYHSAYNPSYIQELNSALIKIGIKANQTIEKIIRLKPEFKESIFYQNGFIFLNERVPNNRENSSNIESKITKNRYKVKLKTNYIESSFIYDTPSNLSLNNKERKYKLHDFGENVIRKAINKLEFYQFSNLVTYLSNLKSISEFIHSDNYLGKINITVSGLQEQIDNPTQDEKLEITIKTLENIASIITSNQRAFKGSKKFKPFKIKEILKDNILKIKHIESSDEKLNETENTYSKTNQNIDLTDKDWYIFEQFYGTSKEIELVKFIDKNYNKIKSKFNKIYLIHNERQLKIYNFKDGQSIKPSFILFLEKKINPKKINYYQIFIKTKNKQLLTNDLKDNFLLKLTDEYQIHDADNVHNYILMGLPFYENSVNFHFEKTLKDLI